MKESYATGRTSDTPTPAQYKEFFAQVASGRITKRKLQGFLRGGTIFKNEDVTRAILGEDIIFPDEIAEVRGLSYTEEQLKHLADTFPSEEVLHWCKANSYALMPGPPAPMSLLEVRSLKPELFYSKSGGWYADQRFSSDDKVGVGWLAIRKEPVSQSTRKNWEEQLRLLSSKERVPNAAELAWFITTFYEVHGMRLFERVYARVCSLDLDGHRVGVGYFVSGGLDVYDVWDDDRRDGLGLAAARKC